MVTPELETVPDRNKYRGLPTLPVLTVACVYDLLGSNRFSFPVPEAMGTDAFTGLFAARRLGYNFSEGRRVFVGVAGTKELIFS